MKGLKKHKDEPSDITSWLLQAWEEKDYFKMLSLPEPDVDELGRPVWQCTSGDVSRAYRRLSVQVHPDKHLGQDARKAFEALNEAHRILKDPGKLEEVLKAAAVKAKAAKEKAEARASVNERIQLNAQQLSRANQLRKEEGKSFNETIVSQMRKRQEESKRKQDALMKSQYTSNLHENGSDEDNSDNEKDRKSSGIVKKRKRHVFI